MGHIQKFFPNGQQGSRAHPTPSMVITSVAPPPPKGNRSHSGRNAGKLPQTTVTSQGTHPRFYAMPTRPTVETSDVVVTCILTVCALDAYALMDPGFTFSYVTPYFALDFGIDQEQLLEPFYVSTPVGDFVIAYRVYRICLYKCYAILDCRAKVVKFEFPNEVTNITAEVVSIQFVPVVNMFPDIFPNELPGIPPDRVINFGIDVVPDTQPISTPLYRMAPAELRELKEKLKDLLDEGFIRPIVSP
ncbi:uncharacterized protein [Nicotiana tomentosiformis]|uniref:uncharacterized protein n=1 Tax=Nicotiana tomentosiformis TaxID=4098 RepID=UPI00388CCC5A